MSVSTFFDHAQSLIPPFFAEMQFQRNETKMFFSDPNAFSRVSEIAQGSVKQTIDIQTTKCITGLLGGTAGSLLTKNPLPLFLGLSKCFPIVSAQQKVRNEFQVNTYTNSSQESPEGKCSPIRSKCLGMERLKAGVAFDRKL